MDRLDIVFPDAPNDDLVRRINKEGRALKLGDIGSRLKEDLGAIKTVWNLKGRLFYSSMIYGYADEFIETSNNETLTDVVIDIADGLHDAINAIAENIVTDIKRDYRNGMELERIHTRIDETEDMFMKIDAEGSFDGIELCSWLYQDMVAVAGDCKYDRPFDHIMLIASISERHSLLLERVFARLSGHPGEGEMAEVYRAHAQNIFEEMREDFHLLQMASIIIPAEVDGRMVFTSNLRSFMDTTDKKYIRLQGWQEKLANVGVAVDLEMDVPPKYRT
ncbi:MAG: hypothetical protein HGA85_04740 [Nanoarchaeota archaeon]|nr:hypothetical protein [Nanoarchaeota archaeon]